MTRRALICVAVLAVMLAASAPSASGQTAEPKIVGGQATTIEEYPWQAAIVVQGGSSAFNRQFCGGSLLATQIVITAAHCLEDDPDCSGPTCLLPGEDPGGDGTEEIDPNDINVVLGVTTLSLAAPGDEYAVLNDPGAVSIHPDWDTNTFQNDVGYIVLAAPVTETTTIKTIDIAGDDEAPVWAPGMFVEISGWGTTIPGQSSSRSDTLRAGSVPIVDDTTCGDPGVYGSDFDPMTMVCAGYPGGGVDTCQGDSGGPLEAPLEASSDYRLIGITSWGFSCAQPNAPGVYTRIAQAAPGGLRDDVQTAVDALEVAYTLADEPIVGSGGQPKSGGPKYPLPESPPPSPPPLLQTGSTAAPPDPFRKCRKIFNKKKRKKCTKRVRRNQAR